MNVTTVTNMGQGQYRLVGEGFTATATLHRSWAKTKKTRVYRTEAIRDAAQAALLERKGTVEPTWPTRPEGVEAWGTSDADRAFKAALDTAQDEFVAYLRAVRRIEKPLVHEALDAIGASVESLSWNAKAGCSCGCSPAYVAPTTLIVKANLFPAYDEPTMCEFAIESLFLK